MRWLLAVWLLICCTELTAPPELKHSDMKEDVCLAWVMYDEARGESVEGQRAVIDVILARTKSRHLSICAVVMERGQFSGYHPGVFSKVDNSQLTQLYRVRRMPPVAENAEFFHSEDVKPTWRMKMKRMLQIGRHIFYKQNKEKQNDKIQTW